MKFCIYWVTPQKAHNSQGWARPKRAARTPSSLPCEWHRSRYLDCHLLSLRVYISKKLHETSPRYCNIGHGHPSEGGCISSVPNKTTVQKHFTLPGRRVWQLGVSLAKMVPMGASMWVLDFYLWIQLLHQPWVRSLQNSLCKSKDLRMILIVPFERHISV